VGLAEGMNLNSAVISSRKRHWQHDGFTGTDPWPFGSMLGKTGVKEWLQHKG